MYKYVSLNHFLQLENDLFKSLFKNNKNIEPKNFLILFWL